MLNLLSSLISLVLMLQSSRWRASAKRLIIDTDLFSDVEYVKFPSFALLSRFNKFWLEKSDIGALLLAATSPSVDLLAVNVNFPSSYSAIAASSILAYFGHPDIPISILRPLTNVTFFDSWFYDLGEYASKVAYHWPGGTLPWGRADDAWDPVSLYRKVLSESPDHSVTIASIGFLDNLSALLDSKGDAHSPLSGRELVGAKVSELVVMGGQYPQGREFNFYGRNSSLTAHVINSWEWPVVFAGFELGVGVKSGKRLMLEGPPNNPASMAYLWYTYGSSRSSWDPLTMLYAIDGLGDMFEYANTFGYNHVYENGSNIWVDDETVNKQYYLRLRVSEDEASAELERRLLDAAWLRTSNPQVGTQEWFMRKQQA